jgi:peptidoglycan/xylan/chitin deacetylase (PgdA/CDA1 family)
MQLSATIFLVAGLVGQTSTWRPGQDGLAPLLSWNQIGEMAGAGITFGAHTMTHIDLANADLAALQRELKGSRLLIEKALNRPVKIMTYPFSRFTPSVKIAVRRAGYQIACSCPTGYVGPANDDAYDLRRITVLAGDRLNDFGAKVNGSLRRHLAWYRRKLAQWRRQLLMQMFNGRSQN